MKNIINFILFLSPIIKFKVREKSMETAIKERSTLLVSRYHYLFKKPKVGEIVVIRLNLQEGSIFTQKGERYIIKRIDKINGDKVFVVGDNEKESVDSRKFGWINKCDIIGKVIFY